MSETPLFHNPVDWMMLALVLWIGIALLMGTIEAQRDAKRRKGASK